MTEGKLVRDLIPDIIRESGRQARRRPIFIRQRVW
jgi:predicted house-cleaning noncanonical NTP pyrophosphatase (MazG superfamily)